MTVEAATGSNSGLLKHTDAPGVLRLRFWVCLGFRV